MPECQLSREYVLDIGQIDGRGMARPSAIVDFMQDIATRHAEQIGLSGEVLQEHNAFWVLSRLRYELDRPLRSYETVRVTTWPRQIKGALWYRDFRFEVNGEEVGRAVTGWAIVDWKTRRLLRPQSLGVEIPEQISGKPEFLRGLRCPETVPCFDRVVRYSDIDVNRHLNNVKAVDILSDAFGLEQSETRWVSKMQVNYLNETRCGTTLQICSCTQENSLIVAAFDGEQENVQAEIFFSDEKG